MNFQGLRALFDLLCERLEDEKVRELLHFELGCGIEFPQGVVMVFVFQEFVIVCRFQVSQKAWDTVSMVSSVRPQSLTAQECLDMTVALREAKSFQELFQ